jgi:hypothetical protein
MAGAQGIQTSDQTSYPQGYWLVGGDGGVFSFGTARYFGSAARLRLGSPIVGMAAPDRGGYWLAGRDGGVLSLGDAHFYGSACTPPPPSTVGTAGAAPAACAANTPTLVAPVVGIASTPDGGGYWLTTADGGVFTFGDARFYGSAAGMRLAAPVVGVSSTVDGGGYWLLGGDGGVFSFGDAGYHGRVLKEEPCYDGASCGAPAYSPTMPVAYSQPVSIASTPTAGGYWIALANGQVFAFGDAHDEGTATGTHLSSGIVAVRAVPAPPSCSAPPGSNGPAPQGYWLIGAEGGVFSYGDAQFHGSAANMHLAMPIVGAGVTPLTPSACPALRRPVPRSTKPA